MAVPEPVGVGEGGGGGGQERETILCHTFSASGPDKSSDDIRPAV